jgi:hypothetical protein
MKAYPYMHKHPTSGQTTISEGMDLRDYFAGQALQGMMVDVYIPDFNHIAKTAYAMADAMMKQRKEVPNE